MDGLERAYRRCIPIKLYVFHKTVSLSLDHNIASPGRRICRDVIRAMARAPAGFP